MLQKLRQVDSRYYFSLVFLIFPIVWSFFDGIPGWLLPATAFFPLAYFGVILSEKTWQTWLCWLFLLVYTYFTVVIITPNFIWFAFYLSNLLIYVLHVTSWRSPFLMTYLGLLMAILATAFAYGASQMDLFFLVIIIVFINLMTFGMMRGQLLEDMRKDQAHQNTQINLLLTENERNRIGQDLHDSLGHTFAMMSIKTDLALQLLQGGAYPQVEKELRELHDISTQSMHEVRSIVENLKKRTLVSELATVKKMLELTGIETAVDNRLDQASLAPQLESTAAMILLELATNTIKHAQAQQVKLAVWADEKGLHLDYQDDGMGFKKVTGHELKTIRGRVSSLNGQLDIVHPVHPTAIQVDLPYEEK